ncbi:MAG TPA: PIN domain-containing protein [Burkholderiaceae bacterium]|nr:PIN domain-containing protein [Burkholderiaceae bacterium]
MTALFDTSVLLDYLLGERRAAVVFKQYEHRALSVITWVELMSVAPAAQHETTRGFLRSFERLSISEAIADEALRVIRERNGIAFHRAITWATAIINQMDFVTVDPEHVLSTDTRVVMPYRWSSRPRASGRNRGG